MKHEGEESCASQYHCPLSKVFIVAVVMIIVLGFSGSANSSDTHLRLGCTVPRDSALHRAVERFFHAVLHNMGVRLTLIAMPNLREQAALVAGEIDGVCGRVKRFDQLAKQRNLQRLPVVIAYSEVSAFSPHPLAFLMDKQASVILSYSLGELSVQRILPALRHHRFKPAPTAEKAAQWLVAGKVGIYVGDDLHFESALRKVRLAQPLHKKVVYTDDYFMFVKNSYSAEFIKRLSDSLREQIAHNGGALNFRDILAGKPVVVEYHHDN